MTQSISEAFEKTANARGVGVLAFDDKKQKAVIGNVSPPSDPNPQLTYPQLIVSRNPSGYWRAGEPSGIVALDEIGPNNNDGVYVGGPTLNQPGLIAGPGSSVNYGANQYVNVLDDSIFSFTDFSGDTPFTLEAWIKPAAVNGLRPIVGKTEKTNGGGPDNEYIFYIFNGSLAVTIYSGNTGDSHTWTTGTGIFVLDDIYHVVATFNGNTSSGLIYLNGLPLAVTYSFNGSYTGMVNTSSDVEIAAVFVNNNSFEDFFDGSISEVAIYNKVLTPTEVSENYTSGITP